MKKSTLFLVLLSLGMVSSSIFAQDLAQRNEISSHYDLDKLTQLEIEFAEEYALEKQKALSLAAIYGWPEHLTLPNGGNGLLIGVYENGKPKYLVTHNPQGAITTRTNKVHTGGGAGLDLNGENMIGGIWDGGRVRETHELIGNRANQIDGDPVISNHSTHVAGTMIGTGAVQGGAAKGMAPEAELWAYNFDSDTPEMTDAAANGLLVSNHSYGANIANVDLWQLGYYDSRAKSFDVITYNAPYYLPICSAGNDRQSGVNPGDGGYDYLTDIGLAKNNITVAAVYEVLNYTGPNSVVMSSFSSWGPADDGRIKPDISAKGVAMHSSVGSSNTSYADYDGTSMATPNTSGSLLLLQQHYNELNGEFMLSSTLKGLALHTADEAGIAPGPDYRFGWGLLNIKKAAEIISDNGDASVIIEDELKSGEVYTMTVQSDGVNDLVASITWTDPAGPSLPAGVEDNPEPVLVHDLDLRVSKDGGATFFPWKLDPANFSAAATKGDNLVDNIEKTEITGASGEYIIQVSHKGNLTETSQAFSLIVTGIDREEFNVSSHDGIVKSCAAAGSATFDIDLGFSDGFTDTVAFTVTGLPGGTTGTIAPTSMSAEGTTVLTVSNINGLSLGDYPIKVTATGTSQTINLYLILRITNDLGIAQVELIYPGNNYQNRPIYNLMFTWAEGNVNVEGYDFELALDDAFTNIVVSENVPIATITVNGLQLETFYWWRVRATSFCETGPFSTVWKFKTTAVAGIDENVIAGLVVYPNPANNILNIEAKSVITAVEIMNVLGQTVISKTLNSNKEQIDISALSTGNYFVRVTSDKNSSVLQVIKQ